MNFEKVGKCFFYILNNKNKRSKKVYISDYKAKKNFEILEAKDDETFVMVPNTDSEREIIYSSGQSGAGKSYSTGLYADEYHKIYPKRGIYLFSLVSGDISVDRKFIKRIDLHKLLQVDLQLDDLKDSLIIFDDIDCIKDKKLKDKMKRIEQNILLMGRHHNISLVYCSHISCRGADSKDILNEASRFTIFPLHMNSCNLKYLAENYIGLDKNQRKELIEMAKKSRSVTYIKNYPPILFSNKKVLILTPKAL